MRKPVDDPLASPGRMSHVTDLSHALSRCCQPRQILNRSFFLHTALDVKPLPNPELQRKDKSMNELKYCV